MDPDDDEFDDRDLLELINLAAYLEGKANRGLFPKARFHRYSGALGRLIMYLADYVAEQEVGNVASDFQTLLTPSPSRGSATVLTHPRFRRRRK